MAETPVNIEHDMEEEESARVTRGRGRRRGRPPAWLKEAAGAAAKELTPPLLISISARAGEVFANQEKALHWLRSPNPSLEGRTPLEVAGTDEGYQEVEDILTRIEHGVLG
jgi:putative toxin-antitoxin system antitoxin component (TIGR02293 family)